jgi:hypothetical protein
MAPRQCGRVTSFLPSTAATRLCRSSLRIPQRHRRRGLSRRSGPEDSPTPRHSNRRTCPELRPKCARRTKSIGSPREASFDAAPLGSGSPAPPARGRACLRARGAVVTGCPPDRPARLAFDGQARAEGRGCARRHRSRHGPCFSGSHRSATQRRRTEDRLGRRHLHCRRGRPLPRTHLSLSRVSRTCRLPGAPLRKAAASERRSPDLDVELRASRRSADRSLATRDQAPCRAWRHGSASLGGTGAGGAFSGAECSNRSRCELTAPACGTRVERRPGPPHHERIWQASRRGHVDPDMFGDRSATPRFASATRPVAPSRGARDATCSRRRGLQVVTVNRSPGRYPGGLRRPERWSRRRRRSDCRRRRWDWLGSGPSGSR